jgi:ArsR family transcriptional regulator
MDAMTRARFDARARILKALAHPTRLFFVDQLAGGERCVCELAAMVDADVSTISKHLALLKNAGLVRDDKRGNRVFYSLTAPEALDFLSTVEAVLKTTAQAQAELLGRS